MRRELIRHELDTLNREEAVLLFDLVDRNQSSFQASMLENTVSLLVARGIVDRAPGYFSQVAWPHTIDQDVWACLKVWVLEHKAAGGDPRIEYTE